MKNEQFLAFQLKNPKEPPLLGVSWAGWIKQRWSTLVKKMNNKGQDSLDYFS